MKLKISIGLLFVVIAAATAWVSYFVWLPEIGSGKVSVLATAESANGERFRVVQFWNGYDFYTTQLEHIDAAGATKVAVIDGDDKKQWSCSLEIVEAEKKVIVTIPSGSKRLREYQWERKLFITPLAKATAGKPKWGAWVYTPRGGAGQPGKGISLSVAAGLSSYA
jgi:hypothetical protein